MEKLRKTNDRLEAELTRTQTAWEKPELIAQKPDEVWPCDTSNIAGPERGVYDELFVIIDIYSRYVSGRTVASAETGELAEAFIADTIDRHGVSRDQLT